MAEQIPYLPELAAETAVAPDPPPAVDELLIARQLAARRKSDERHDKLGEMITPFVAGAWGEIIIATTQNESLISAKSMGGGVVVAALTAGALYKTRKTKN